jgi:hypothetical protein
VAEHLPSKQKEKEVTAENFSNSVKTLIHIFIEFNKSG